jgi:hypothetical protein
MEFSWAATVDPSQMEQLATLRLQPGVEAGSADGTYWLRGAASEEVLHRVQMIPHVKLFHLDPGNTLRPWNRLLATGQLPDIPFEPISKMVQPVLPHAGWPTVGMARIPLSLVRSSQMLPASILMTSKSVWSDYTVSAPVIRLRCWKFAVSDDDRVIIRGEPIPPLPGQQFLETDGVAIPVGWTCSPALEGSMLSTVVEAEPGGLVVLSTDGAMETIPQAAFVNATRSAVRRSSS